MEYEGLSLDKALSEAGIFPKTFFFVELLQVKRGVYIDIASSLRFPTCFFTFFLFFCWCLFFLFWSGEEG